MVKVKDRVKNNTKIKKKTSPKKRKRYEAASLAQALDAVRKGMPKKQAAKTYGVPRTTLIFQLSHPECKKKPGPATILTAEEEEKLTDWIAVNGKKGFPRRKDDLISSVAEYLKKNNKVNPFKNGIPGEKWFTLFMSRHPEISFRTPEAVTAASSCVSEIDIRNWFSKIETYLKENDYYRILKDPSRVLNGDETNFQLCPKGERVLAVKGEKNVYEVDQGQAKSTVTVLFTFKANGDQTPPLVIYPYKRLPKDIAKQVPPEWGIGLSDNGWMKADIFMDYLQNILHPHLVQTKTKFPVILFVDGHKTHVTLNVSELCTKLNIILIALYPNATRILQPADVSAFKPLKNGWKKSVHEWRRENPSEALTKHEFAPILKTALKSSIRPEILQNGFRAAGLYPWCPDNINFEKCLGQKPIKSGASGCQTTQMNKQTFLSIVSECNREDNEILKKVCNYFKVAYPFASPEASKQNSPEEVVGVPILPSSAKPMLNSEQIMDSNQESSKYDIAKLPVIIASEEWHEVNSNHHTPNEEINPNSVEVPMEIIQMLPQLPSTSTAPLYHTVDVSSDTQTDHTISTNSLETINLKDCLYVAKTPARKGLKNTERTSFVLTSEEFQKRERQKAAEKKKKIDDIQRRKEERMLKQAKKKPVVKPKSSMMNKKVLPKLIISKQSPIISQQNPSTSNSGNRNSTEKIIQTHAPTITAQKTIPSTKKINVLSNIVIAKPSPILTDNSNKYSPVLLRHSYAKAIDEKLKKIKMQLNFDKKPKINNLADVKENEDSMKGKEPKFISGEEIEEVLKENSQ